MNMKYLCSAVRPVFFSARPLLSIAAGILVPGLLALAAGCSGRPGHSGEDSGKEASGFHIKRYELALFGLDQSQLVKGLKEISFEYAFFIGGNLADTSRISQLKQYLNDPLIREVYEASRKSYPDMKIHESQLSGAFGQIAKDFPGFRQPGVFTYISGLDYETPVRVADSVMVIAIDMYLGRNSQFYRNVGMPAYKAMRCEPAFIAPDCMRALALTMNNTGMNGNTLLDYMLNEGKVLYFIRRALPEAPDSVVIGYAGKQLQWVTGNEARIWSFLIENKFLFSTDPSVMNKFLSDAPFTPAFTRESPGNIGSWIGWRIISAYMKNNPGVGMPELFAEKDAQKILNGSRYKPGK